MRALVLLSGGIDSAVSLALAIEKYGKENVDTLSINYGQKNINELNSVSKICEFYNIKNNTIDISNVFSQNENCSLIKGNKHIPKISYDKQIIENKKNETSTNVPFRNGLMLSVATSVAIDKKCDVIYYGIHHEDGVAEKLYPDCSNEFNIKMNEVIKTATNNEVSIYAPLVKLSKKEIVEIGSRLKVPFDLTWTCYDDGDKACGKCTACTDRLKAFESLNLQDPIEYM